MNINGMLISDAYGTKYISFDFKPYGYSNARYLIKSIHGLDPDEIKVKDLSTDDAEKRSFSLSEREIVMRFILQPDFANGESYGSLRDEIYRFIAANKQGHIVLAFFETEFGDIVGPGVIPEALVSGFITKVEAPLTQEIPEMQITIDCSKDPMLVSHVENTNYVLAGDVATVGDIVSSAPHGFEFEIQITADCGDNPFTIHNTLPDDELVINLGDLLDDGNVGFKNNDRLYFSSITNNREIYLTRGSIEYQIPDKLEHNTVWPLIFPGTNYIVLNPGPIGDFIWLHFTHYNTFWGV